MTVTALLARRRYAVPLLVVMLATTGVLVLLGESPGGVLALVALFTVAERCRTGVSVVALVVTVAVLVALSATSAAPPLAVWAAGAALRSRRQHRDELQARADAAREQREQRAAIAAYEERAAIARELHDIVAHSVTVMLVGVRGARDVLPTGPDVAADVLARVETGGEQSLVELRRLLALLRATPATTAPPTTAPAPTAPAPNRPLPGLAELPELVAGFEAAGVTVDLEISGNPPALDEGIGLSIYRITEEALTNVVRHGGTDHAVVRLSHGPGELHLEVVDAGAGPKAGDPRDGHGIVGMRERALLLGGQLVAGPDAGGGFRVDARLPVRGGR